MQNPMKLHLKVAMLSSCSTEISQALENASESCATFSSHLTSEEYFSNSDVDCFVSSLSDSIGVEQKGKADSQGKYEF